MDLLVAPAGGDYEVSYPGRDGGQPGWMQNRTRGRACRNLDVPSSRRPGSAN